jgi:soluble lytic murein transglycosylase-like protein
MEAMRADAGTGINVQERPKRKLLARLSVALASCAVLPAHACWDDAAMRYQVSSALLYAIARTESALNPLAIGRNPNGSRDIGLMQINSAWLPTLATHGIGERDLLEPCTSIHVGAWILAGNVSRLGYTWEAVGAYNAANPALRRAYAEKVRRHLAADTPASGSSRRASNHVSAR